MKPSHSGTQLQSLIDEVRTSDALFVVGAGASFDSGMPLAGQLSTLVWQTLDAHPNLRDRLCEKIGHSITDAKTAIGDDWVKICASCALIKENPAAFATFRRIFGRLNQDRGTGYSGVHDGLAQLIYHNRARGVISLNWDTLLEAAFTRRYGFMLEPQEAGLWKPHGDCGSSGDWVLPHESGAIPAALVQWINGIAAERPRVLVLIGYSERDDVVVQRLIQPLAKRWRIFRISPSATGEGAIRCHASEAVKQMVEQLLGSALFPGWASVSFGNPRGIEAAIAGERLGPDDADACPRLPHFAPAKERLTLLHRIEIAGEPGSGKSVTAWQLAREYHRQGWQVLRAIPLNGKDELAALEAVRRQRWLSVVVVDDSQTYSREFVNGLRDSAHARLKVIVCTTDPNWEQTSAVRVSAIAAVETLATECRRRKNTILPIVRQFDSHVGDAYMETRYEDRVASAEREGTPWQFCYVLRAGWKQTRAIVNSARDFDEAHLALVIISVRQLVTLDRGIGSSELVQDALRIGRDENWTKKCLELLSTQRTILLGERIRCLHLRAAAAIIDAALKAGSSKEREKVAELTSSIISDSAANLRGVAWLLWELWGEERTAVLTLKTKQTLLIRAFSAQTHLERRDAALMIDRLLGWRDATIRDTLQTKIGVLRSWIEEADAEDAYALSQAMNNFYNDDKDAFGTLVRSIDPAGIAAKIKSVTPRTAYRWGNFLERLSCGADDRWRSDLVKALPRDSLELLVTNCPPEEVGQLVELLKGLWCLDPETSQEFLRRAIPAIGRAFAADPIRAYRDIYDLEFTVLGWGLFGDGHPSRQQRAITKEFFAPIVPARVVHGILNCRYGDWETYSRLLGWLKQAHPQRHGEVVEAMDWNHLGLAMDQHWKEPGREMRLLLLNLVTKPDGEPVRTWLQQFSSKIDEIDPILVGVSPELGIAVARQNGKINLAGHNGNWHGQEWAVARVAGLDEEVARKILRMNFNHLVEGITQLSLPDGLPQFLLLAGKLDSTLFADIAQAVDLTKATSAWEKALKDSRVKERKAARDTLKILSTINTGSISQMAGQLLATVRYRRRVKGSPEP